MIGKSKSLLFIGPVGFALSMTVGCATSPPSSVEGGIADSTSPKTTTITGQQAIEGALTTEQLIEELRNGGEVLYFRHISTDGKPYKDQQETQLGDCSTQRVIGKKGWEEANVIRKGIELSGIPVGEVYTSEYCRAWQTASLVFGKFSLNPTLTAMSAEPSSEEKALRKPIVEALFSAIPQNANTVLVGHSDVFKLVTDIKPEPQGVAYVLSPQGDSFKVLGSIAPEEWGSHSR